MVLFDSTDVFELLRGGDDVLLPSAWPRLLLLSRLQRLPALPLLSVPAGLWTYVYERIGGTGIGLLLLDELLLPPLVIGIMTGGC